MDDDLDPKADAEEEAPEDIEKMVLEDDIFDDGNSADFEGDLSY